MKVSEYVKNYTSGDRISFWHILDEYKELLVEVSSGNWKGMNEEWQDVLHFVQLWLYWRFKVDGEMWSCTSQSVAKFMERVKVWHDIYEYVGLPRGSSNFCGNYKKFEKVAKQLAKFGVDGKRAKEAYDRIVVGV
jgi:hypothetical protein